MTGEGIAAIIGALGVAVPSVLLGVTQVVMTVRQNRKIAEATAVSMSNAVKLDTHTTKLDAVEKATDGIVTKMAEASKEEGRAQGHEAGVREGNLEGLAAGLTLAKAPNVEGREGG